VQPAIRLYTFLPSFWAITRHYKFLLNVKWGGWREVRGLRKCPWRFCRFLKASMVGFTLVSRSYYYLRRRRQSRPPVPARPPSTGRGSRGTGGYKKKLPSQKKKLQSQKKSRETFGFARHPARESQSDGRFILSSSLRSSSPAPCSPPVPLTLCQHDMSP
jgi:hypothetical protein